LSFATATTKRLKRLELFELSENSSTSQRVGSIARLFMAWHLAALLLFAGIAVGQDPPKLKSAWCPWDPYQYVRVKNDVKRLTGLDVQLVRAVFAQMGYNLVYEEVSWKQLKL
jgi:hypothetical protein